MGVLRISTNFAIEQIRRLQKAKLSNYPGEWSEGEDAMVRALVENANSEAHAKSVVDRLIAGWRNPDLDPQQRAKDARFCPQAIDVIQACRLDDEPDPRSFVPPIFESERVNPMDRMMDASWFWSEMWDDLLLGYEHMANNSPSTSARKLASSIVATQGRRRAEMGEDAWQRERERANQLAAKFERVEGGEVVCIDRGQRK